MNIELPIKNFALQQEIFNSPARIVAIKKGRRFGFTKGAANNTQRVALSGLKKKGLWVDTVNSNIERYVERFFIPSLKKLPPSLWKWQKQQKVLHIGNFYMDFRSVDTPENIEGFGYDYMILNEAGIILKNEYLWSNAIRPMMWDSDCQVFIGGTPKGGGGVFEDLYNRGLDPEQKQFASFHVTSFDNPYIPRGVIEEDMKSMPQRVIDQEIYANFLDDSGIVFRNVKNVAVLPTLPVPPVQENHIYVVGADLAKLEDFTVIVVYDRTDNKQVYQMRFNHLEWPFIRSKIQETSRKFNNALVVIDSTGVGDPTTDDLMRAGVPVEPIKFTNVVKKQLIEKLANWIELRNLQMLNIDETIRELTIFTYDFSEKTDRVFYGAPSGFHDDIVIAHALACWSLQPVIKQILIKEPSLIHSDYLQKMAAFDNNSEDGYE